MQRIVIIDNYDSFTYNLSHLLKEVGADVTVFRNDQFRLEELQQFDKIVLSPGPGIPSEAGLLLDVIRAYAPTKPMLGVCLGHQAIGEVFGARLLNLSMALQRPVALSPPTPSLAVLRKASPSVATTRGWCRRRIFRRALKSLP